MTCKLCHTETPWTDCTEYEGRIIVCCAPCENGIQDLARRLKPSKPSNSCKVCKKNIRHARTTSNDDESRILCSQCDKAIEDIKRDQKDSNADDHVHWDLYKRDDEVNVRLIEKCNELDSRIDQLERESNWHNEQGDKELAQALKRIRKLERSNKK